MRLGRARLVGLLVTAGAVVGVLVVSSASAVTAPQTVVLHVTVNGSGTVRVPGHAAFICHASFPTSSHCRRTFRVRKGRRIVIRESPASDWKLTRWAGACHGTAASCSLRVKARRFGFVTASFVPPGDRLNPYPLGATATLTQGWQMKVNSTIINADAQVEAVNNQSPPPAGTQYTLVNVSMTYTGAGSRSLPGYLQPGVQAVGAGNAGSVYGCQPPPLDLNSDFTPVSSGQTVTGNLCFEIASDDAARLLLQGQGMAGAVWFALR
jgi:hypothetical protein